MIFQQATELNSEGIASSCAWIMSAPIDEPAIQQPSPYAIVTLPEVPGPRRDRGPLWSWAASLGLHIFGLIIGLFVLGTTADFHWKPLPLESRTAVVCLTVAMSDETELQVIETQFEIQPPAELKPLPVTVPQVELEHQHDPLEVEVVGEDSPVIAPSPMPLHDSRPLVQNVPPPTRAVVPRAVLTKVPPIATVAHTVPVESVATMIADSPPRVVYNPPPTYPAAQRAARITGRVIFLATIDWRGSVAALVVEQSSGSVALDEAARQAVSRWRFEPTGNGSAITREVRIPVTFRIAAGS